MKITRHFQTSIDARSGDKFQRYHVGLDIEKEFPDDEVKTGGQIEEKANAMLATIRRIVSKEVAELKETLRNGGARI